MKKAIVLGLAALLIGGAYAETVQIGGSNARDYDWSAAVIDFIATLEAHPSLYP